MLCSLEQTARIKMTLKHKLILASVCLFIIPLSSGWRSVAAEPGSQINLTSTFHDSMKAEGKDWCWSWSFNILATWCEEPTHWKRPWCWERLMSGGEGDDRGWDGWMASPTRWTWICVSSGRWWRTQKSGMLQSMGSQRAGHDLVNERQQQWKYHFIGLFWGAND